MSETESINPLESEPTSGTTANNPPAATSVAILWAVAAVIFGIILLVNAKDESYGGDAYTGIQHTIAWAVRGIAFLLFGSGALGVVIAIRRNRN